MERKDNDLLDKCTIAFSTGCDSDIDNSTFIMLRRQLTRESSNHDIAAACVHLDWLMSGKRKKSMFQYEDRIETALASLNEFDVVNTNEKLELIAYGTPILLSKHSQA
jgi:hypothetical protein